MNDPIPSPKEMREQALRDLSPKDRYFIEKMKKDREELPIWLKHH